MTTEAMVESIKSDAAKKLDTPRYRFAFEGKTYEAAVHTARNTVQLVVSEPAGFTTLFVVAFDISDGHISGLTIFRPNTLSESTPVALAAVAGYLGEQK